MYDVVRCHTWSRVNIAYEYVFDSSIRYNLSMLIPMNIICSKSSVLSIIIPRNTTGAYSISDRPLMLLLHHEFHLISTEIILSIIIHMLTRDIMLDRHWGEAGSSLSIFVSQVGFETRHGILWHRNERWTGSVRYICWHNTNSRCDWREGTKSVASSFPLPATKEEYVA